MAHEFCPEGHCTGCAACAACCPSSAISMSRKVKGFFYPRLQKGRCADCRPALPCCPLQDRQTYERLPTPAYYAAAPEEPLGHGVFLALAEECLAQGGAVFGARWGDLHSDRPLYHASARHRGGLAALCGAGYLQSQTDQSYTETRWLLSAGISVLYAGTPCQIAGLYTAMGGERDGLLTCDFVCRGVGSPLFFREWLSFWEQAEGRRAQAVSIGGGDRGGVQAAIRFEDGKRIRRPLYQSAEALEAAARPCCKNCGFQPVPRLGDITLGDAFVQVNSERGLALLRTAQQQSTVNR